MSLDLPHPRDISSFKALAEHESTEAFLPIFTADINRTPDGVIAFLWYSSNITRLVIYESDTENWEVIDRSTRTNPVFHDVDSVIDTSVVLVGEDIDQELDLYYRLKDEIRENYYPDLPDEYSEVGDSEVDLRESIACDHGSPIESRSDEIPAQVKRCRVCGYIHEVTFNGEMVDRGEFLDVDWLRNNTPDSLVWQNDSGRTGLVSPKDSEFTWVDVALYVLGKDAARESRTITGYEPEVMSGAVVGDSDVLGFATWNRALNEMGTAMLRQVYVRPEYRQQGVARDIVETWWNSMADDRFYVADPNPVGQAIIRSLGYYDAETDGRAVASDTRVIKSLGLPSVRIQL